VSWQHREASTLRPYSGQASPRLAPPRAESKGGASCVFLDRDGVIIRDVNHLASARHLRLLPGATQAIRKLNEAGLKVVTVTNQSAIGRGWLSQGELDAIHADLVRRLARSGAHLDGIYSCPHHPTAATGEYRRDCSCRKPRPGLLLRAARELHLSLPDSIMIGDKPSDLEAGRRAGCATVLVLSGKGRQTLRELGRSTMGNLVDVVCATLPRAVDWCLERLRAQTARKLRP